MRIFSALSFWLLTTCARNVNGYRSERMPPSNGKDYVDENEDVVKRGIRGVRAKPEGPNDEKGRRANKGTSNTGREQTKVGSSETSGTTRVLLHYVDDEGRDKASAAANKVLADIPDKNRMVLEVDDDNFEKLRVDKTIKQIEVDHQVQGLSAGELLGRSPQLHDHRELAEIVPYGIEMIQADQLAVGSHEVKVCIPDTGYAKKHPDLPNSARGSDRNSHSGEFWEWDRDLNGHGTHLAGVIAAISGNNKGIAGAGNIKLHITRSLNEYSEGFESDTISAVEQCVAAGAKVICLSLGGMDKSASSQEFYRKIVEEDGVLVVAAAGNYAGNNHLYPASYPHVISVSAVYPWGRYWEGSNYSDQVELAAPGYKILSTMASGVALHMSDISFPGIRVSGAPESEVGGVLVDCGPGNYQCYSASGKICVMVRDQTDLKTMMNNCGNGGGIGAVIFDASDDNSYSVTSYHGIPAIAVRREIAEDLFESHIGSFAQIGFSNNNREYTYDYYTGTSMATPHVAAAAALVWSHFPDCTNEQIRYALAVTAQDQGYSGCDWDYGYGIVKAKDAYDFLQQNSCSSGSWANAHNLNNRGGCTTPL